MAYRDSLYVCMYSVDVIYFVRLTLDVSCGIRNPLTWLWHKIASVSNASNAASFRNWARFNERTPRKQMAAMHSVDLFCKYNAGTLYLTP